MPNLIDIRQTPEYASYMRKVGWKIGKLSIQDLPPVDGPRSWIVIRYFVKKLPFLPFTFIKIHRPPVDIPLSAVNLLARKHKAFFIKISPSVPSCHSWPDQESHSGSIISFPAPLIYKFYSRHKFHIDDDPMIATKTIWIDLSKGEEELLKNMKPKTRYNIKKSESYLLSSRAKVEGLKVKSYYGNKLTSNQIQNIYHLWRQNNRRLGLFTPCINDLIHLIKSFGKNCFVVFLTPGVGTSLTPGVNDLLAFSLCLLSHNMAFYWHNASTPEGRQLFAPTLCTWETIRQSQKLDKQIFDFEGIFDERHPQVFKKWKGFSRFKEGFVKTRPLVSRQYYK